MSSVLPDNFKEKVKDLPCSLLQVALDDELTIVSANANIFLHGSRYDGIYD